MHWFMSPWQACLSFYHILCTMYLVDKLNNFDRKIKHFLWFEKINNFCTVWCGNGIGRLGWNSYRYQKCFVCVVLSNILSEHFKQTKKNVLGQLYQWAAFYCCCCFHFFSRFYAFHFETLLAIETQFIATIWWIIQWNFDTCCHCKIFCVVIYK